MNAVNQEILSLFAMYDLSYQPADYRYVDFLAQVREHQNTIGAESVVVCIIPSTDNHPNKPEFWIIKNILVPLTSFIGEFSNPTVFRSRDQAKRFLHGKAGMLFPKGYDFHEAPRHKFRAGSLEEMNVATASSEAVKYAENWLNARGSAKNFITITLIGHRPYKQHPSMIKSMISLAKQLQAPDTLPVLIPDFEEQTAPNELDFEGLLVYSEASVNVQLLAATYQSSRVNIMAWDGPHQLCRYNQDCKYIILTDDEFAEADSGVYFKRGNIIELAPSPSSLTAVIKNIRQHLT